MLKATEEEIEEIREYFEWQASDLEVTFMQKVYSETVVNTRHDVWASIPTRIAGGSSRAERTFTLRSSSQIWTLL
jgi:hypothetical protein